MDLKKPDFFLPVPLFNKFLENSQMLDQFIDNHDKENSNLLHLYIIFTLYQKHMFDEITRTLQ